MQNIRTFLVLTLLFTACGKSGQTWVCTDGNADHKGATMTFTNSDVMMHLPFKEFDFEKGESKIVFRDYAFHIAETAYDPLDKNSFVYIVQNTTTNYCSVLAGYNNIDGSRNFMPYDATVEVLTEPKAVIRQLQADNNEMMNTVLRAAKMEGWTFTLKE